MKKFSTILLSILICLAFFGCSAEKGDTVELLAESTTTTIAQSSVEAETSSGESSANSSSEVGTTTSSTVTATTSATTSVTTVKSQSTKTTATKATTASTAKSQSTKATTTRGTSSTAKATTKKSSTQTTTSKYITCTVTVECSSILNNMDSLKDGHQSYVPSDGYMIKNYSVTVSNGSSVYDAVKTACDEQGVYMNSTGSSYGKYVVGFNNIDEKDCGKQSGWLYKVNNVTPSKSCDKYILSNGDNVVFTYTCTY